MIGLFNPENKFWNFIGKLVDMLLMSLLWFFCSLPVITAGAATAAFYRFTLHQAEDTEGNVLSGFFRAFAQNFKKATLCWLLEIALLLFLLADIWICLRMGDVWYARAGMFSLASITLMVLLVQVYVFPLIAVFDFPVKKVLRDSFIMAMGNLPVTITVLVLFALAAVGTYYLPFFFCFFAGLAVFASSYFLLFVLKRYMPDANSSEVE